MNDIDYLDAIGTILDERLHGVFNGCVFCYKQRLLRGGRVDCINLCMYAGAVMVVVGDVIIDGGSLSLVLDTTFVLDTMAVKRQSVMKTDAEAEFSVCYKYDLCDPDVIDKVVGAVGVIYSRVVLGVYE